MEEGSPLTRKNTGYDRISWGQINGLGASPEGASNALDDGSPLRRRTTGYERVDWNFINRLEASPETAAALAVSDENGRHNGLENLARSRIPPPDFFAMPSSPPEPILPGLSHSRTGFAGQPPNQTNYWQKSFLETQFEQNVYAAEYMVIELTEKVTNLENLIARYKEVWLACLGKWFTGGTLDWCEYRDSVFAGLHYIHYIGPNLDATLVGIEVSMAHYWSLYPIDLVQRAREVHFKILNLRHRMNQVTLPDH